MNHAPASSPVPATVNVWAWRLLRGVRRIARPGLRLLARAATSRLTSALIVGLATWLTVGVASLISTPAHAQMPSRSGQADRSSSISTGNNSTLDAAPRPAAAARTALADPTRPPPGAALPMPPSLPGAPTAGSPARPAMPANVPPPAPPQLQGLRLPHSGAPSALIDGQLRLLGERLRDWTVQDIRADGVLLGRPAAPPHRATPVDTGTAAPSPSPDSAASHRPARPGHTTLAQTASAPAPALQTLWLALLPPLAASAPTRP